MINDIRAADHAKNTKKLNNYNKNLKNCITRFIWHCYFHKLIKSQSRSFRQELIAQQFQNFLFERKNQIREFLKSSWS